MNNFKKVLLTGTALIAAAGFSASAQAQLIIDANDNGVNDTEATIADPIITTANDHILENTGTVNVNADAVIGETSTDADGLTANTDAQDLNITTGVEADGTVSLTVNGNITLGTGVENLDVNVTSFTDTNASAEVLNLVVNGSANLGTGVLTVTSNAGNGENNNASASFTGDLTASNIVLQEETAVAADVATLTLNGSAAQVITGTINGGATGEGTLVVNNSASTVTFASAVGTTSLGAITITDATETVFQSTVGAAAMTLAAGKDVEFQDNATITTLTFANDATTELQFAGSSAQTFTGVIAGTDGADGILNIDNSTTVIGNIGTTNSIAALDIATGQTFTLQTGSGVDDQIDATTLNGTAVFVLDTQDEAGESVLTGNVVAAADGNGTVRVTGAQTARISGNTGASGADVGALQVTGLANTMTADFAGNVYANGVAVDASTATDVNTVILGNGGGNTVEITGAITAAENNVHVLEFDAGTASFVTGDIGTSTNAFATVTLSDNIDLRGNVYATNVGGSGDLTLGGSSAQTVTSTVNTTGALATSNAAGVTFTNGVTVTGGVTNTGSTTFQGATNDAGSAYTNTGGSTYVAPTATLTSAAFTDDGTYYLQANAATIGKLTDDSVAADLDEAQLAINVTGAVDVATVNSVLTGFNAFTADSVLTDDSAQYTFTLAANGDIAVTKASAASLSTSSATAGVGAAIDDLGDTPANADLLALVDRVAAASSAEAVDTILEQSASDASGGAAVAGLTVSNQTAQITGQRLASLRTGTGTGTGVAAGGQMDNGLKAWGQVFGTTADQDKRDGVAGYDADTAGFAAGMDTELNDNAVVGVALSYANTEVDSEDANSSSTDVDTYQVTVYGDYDIDANTFLSGQVSYAHGQNDTERKNVGGTSNTAKGEFDSKQFGVRAEVGRSYDAGHGLTLVPSVLANYVHYDADSYTETGAGGSNLTVDADTLSIFELGANVEVSTTQEFTDGSAIKPSLSLGVRHDLIGDEFEASNTFAGGGNAFKVEGFDPAQTTFSAGAGVTYFSADQWELSAEYDFEAKSDYQSHSGLLKAAYKF